MGFVLPLDFKSLNVDVERNLVLEREREREREEH